MAVSLSDLVRESENLSVTCGNGPGRGCGNSEIIEGEALERFFRLKNWDQSFSSLSRHLRCGRCRSKELTFRRTSQPHTKVIGPTTPHEFNRMRQAMRG